MMHYSVIEKTDVRVSQVSFGTASLHHLFGAKQRLRLLNTAASIGVSHFDTSPYYGHGLAEYDLGIFMQGQRDKFTITSKVGIYPIGGEVKGAFTLWTQKLAGKLYSRISVPDVDWCVQRATKSLNDSLRRLKTDYIDFIFLHEPNIELLNTDEFLTWFENERSKGKIRYWGLAGEPALLKPWLLADHPLAKVLQTRDDLGSKSADFILESKRNLQFTYGYISAQSRGVCDQQTPSEILREALIRNKYGSVLISTRQPERLKQLAELINE